MDLSIGELSRRTRVKVPTIRYYEQIGLLPAPPRSEGQQRRYDPAHVARLSFVRHARDLGFEIEAIRELLRMNAHPTDPCAEVDQMAIRHIAAIDARIAGLNSLRAELQRTVEACHHGRIADCAVIEALTGG